MTKQHNKQPANNQTNKKRNNQTRKRCASHAKMNKVNTVSHQSIFFNLPKDELQEPTSRPVKDLSCRCDSNLCSNILTRKGNTRKIFKAFYSSVMGWASPVKRAVSSCLSSPLFYTFQHSSEIFHFSFLFQVFSLIHSSSVLQHL